MAAASLKSKSNRRSTVIKKDLGEKGAHIFLKEFIKTTDKKRAAKGRAVYINKKYRLED